MSIREKLLMQKIKKRERIKKELTKKKNSSFVVTTATPPKGKGKIQSNLVGIHFLTEFISDCVGKHSNGIAEKEKVPQKRKNA